MKKLLAPLLVPMVIAGPPDVSMIAPGRRMIFTSSVCSAMTMPSVSGLGGSVSQVTV